MKRILESDTYQLPLEPLERARQANLRGHGNRAASPSYNSRLGRISPPYASIASPFEDDMDGPPQGSSPLLVPVNGGVDRGYAPVASRDRAQATGPVVVSPSLATPQDVSHIAGALKLERSFPDGSSGSVLGRPRGVSGAGARSPGSSVVHNGLWGNESDEEEYAEVNDMDTVDEKDGSGLTLRSKLDLHLSPSTSIASILASCWRRLPSARPSAADIAHQLEHLLLDDVSDPS